MRTSEGVGFGTATIGQEAVRPCPQRDLDALAVATGRTRSDIAREALRRRVAVLRFDEARRAVLPFTEARGYLTDEDVFRDVS